MSELFILIGSGGITLLTSYFKTKMPNLSPLFIVALLSLISGLIYSAFQSYIPENIVEIIMRAGAYSVLIYETLKTLIKNK